MNRIILILSTILFLLTSCNNKEKKAQQEHDADVKKSTFVEKGQTVPAFSYITLQGDTVNINDHKGKVVFMNFFATWCPICIKELPYIKKELAEKYKNHPEFELLIFGREHTAEEMVAFKEKNGYTMNFIPDPERKIYALFAEKYIPRNIILNREGRIIYQGTGFNEEEFKELQQMLENEIKR